MITSITKFHICNINLNLDENQSILYNKMDYKKMDTKELLHEISNVCDKEEIVDGDKLVIQNITKELFNKKCEKYKKVYYIRHKIVKKECDEGDGCDWEEHSLISSYKEKIIEYDTYSSSDFPNKLTKDHYKSFKKDGILVVRCRAWNGEKQEVKYYHFTIYKIEDIEL